MKKRYWLLWLPVLLLCGCARIGETAEKTVCVSIAENPGFSVENNGQRVTPGEEVTFSLQTLPGYTVTQVDYGGTYRLWQEDTHILLTLENVRYPTQTHVDVTNSYFELTYFPNGGEGETQTVRQKKGVHLRPNTSIGTEYFSRPGYTLIGWNTQPDGSGISVGLGSRVTVPDAGIALYAQWAKWEAESSFDWRVEENGTAVITGYKGNAEILTIPEILGGAEVTDIEENAFVGCGAQTIILPQTMQNVADGAFAGSTMKALYLFDNLEYISDGAIAGCSNLQTLHINAIEAPSGYASRKESCYADKVDLLYAAQGKKKLVFYGGCSMWYNLDMKQVLEKYGKTYLPVDIALNGTVNSQLQLEILDKFLEPGDVIFHTPELSSPFQMMTSVNMGRKDTPLWSGLENNYDLLTLADMRNVTGVLDSFCWYLSRKSEETSYELFYLDSRGNSYFGAYGEVPFARYEQIHGELADEVMLRPELITPEGTERLKAWYAHFAQEGVQVLVSYASLNRDAISKEEWENADAVDAAFREAIGNMEGATLISKLKDYAYFAGDFYDTNYHLLTAQAERNTKTWLRDLKPYLPWDE